MASEIKVDTIVNAGGDNDSGIDLATNDNIKFNIAGSQKAIIDASGNVGIGTSSPTISNGRGLVIADATAARLKLCDTTTGEGASDGFQVGHSGALAFIFNHEDEPIQFGTNNTERFRINNSNHVLFYTTSNSAPDGNGGVIVADDGNGSFIQISKKTTSAVPAMEFYNSNGRVGQIIPSGSATSFTTSSDYRLKENVTASWDATTRLKQLKPSRFNFKADKDTVLDGFLAHEVSSIVPEAITGAKDAVDKDGKPEYQGIDQSKLVPLLTKSLQEALARIDTLEAEVAKLKG